MPMPNASSDFAQKASFFEQSRTKFGQLYPDVRYFWVGLPTFLGLFIGTTFARAP